MNPGISVVIPSWNGLHLLKENLPSVLAAARLYEQEKSSQVEVLIVDDGSRDCTVPELERLFPEVKVVVRERNGGFARACNSGFERCSMPLVALLNNDVQVEADYLLRIVCGFRKHDVFAVTAKVLSSTPRFLRPVVRWLFFAVVFGCVYQLRCP